MCSVVVFVFFFFFKQKTAYEMRISDWSSDVCSSDLLAQQRAERVLVGRQAFAPERHAAAPGRDWAHASREPSVPRPGTAGSARARVRRPGAVRVRPSPGCGSASRRDRKGVVSGKSGSGRVDPGGGRIIKKKNKRNK